MTEVTSVYERFTDPARHALIDARKLATALGHDWVGTEHLLLSLTRTPGPTADLLHTHGVDFAPARAETLRLTGAHRQAPPGQAARDALSSIGIDVTEIQRRADETFGPGHFTYPRAAFSLPLKRVLQASLHQARELGEEHIDTAHLLLGLLETGGTAGRVLSALGTDPAPLRQGLRDSLLSE